MGWKRSVAISLASAALVLAGCGDDGESAVDTGEPTPAAELALTHPVISEPVDGATLKADGQENDVLTTTVLVRGVAEPATRVVISTGCEQEGCQKPLRTAADGAFETEVLLVTHAARPRGTIIVGYEDSGASVDSDRVVVTVRVPGVAEAPSEDTTPERSRTPPPASAPPSGASTSARRLIVIGDSLAVGMRPYLQQYLAGWDITVDARVGRPLAEGMSRFDATAAPSRETVFAFSLFTNDGPTGVTALASAVERSSAKGCAVWATIVRPPVRGTSYAAANARLDALAAASPGRLRVAEWADQVSGNAGWMTGDGVHATPTGYRNRAALYAAAIKSCSG